MLEKFVRKIARKIVGKNEKKCAKNLSVEIVRTKMLEKFFGKIVGTKILEKIIKKNCCKLLLEKNFQKIIIRK